MHAALSQQEVLGDALADGAFLRWVLPSKSEELQYRLTSDDPDEADAIILPRLLPLEASDAAIAEQLSHLPLKIDGTTLHFADQTYDDPRQTLTVRLPNTSPSTWVVLGQDVERVAQATDSVLIQASGVRWWRQAPKVDYRVREHDFAERSGDWQRSPDGTITVDADGRDDLLARNRHYASLSRHAEGSVRLWTSQHRDPKQAVSLARQLDAASQRYAKALGLDASTLDVVVEPNFEVQGRHLGELGAAVLAEGLLPSDMLPSEASPLDGLPSSDDVQSLHIVLHSDDTPFYRHGIARLLLRRAGYRLPHWLEYGAALWLSDDWYDRSFRDWLPDLLAAEVVPGTDAFLAETPQEDSSAVLWPPLAAAVIDHLPGDSLQAKLDLLRAPSDRAKRLEIAGQALLAADAQGEARSKPERPQTELEGFRQGVSFAMANGLDIGYHAPGVDDALGKVRDLGADSVSVMPFAYQWYPDQPQLRYLNQHPSSETDIGTLHAARRAHALDFRVLWKPHIWISFDSWPGDIVMSSEADWNTWFQDYRRYILHHAVLAQWSGSELFSIGVELGQTVHRETQWRRLIEDVRRVYRGHVTYAGNWWADYDQVPFWDALDVIGVDAYFPLSNDPEASPQTLREGARQAADNLRRFADSHARPMLFTETGFAARRGAWVQPHEEGGELSEEDQRQAYEAWLDVLGKPSWLRGIYVWKAFSHARAEGGDRPDFRFLGRPAEAEVQRYFESPSRQSPLGQPTAQP